MNKALLIFTLTQGFRHDSIPAGIEALRLLGETSGAYHVVATEDPAVFEPDRLKAFDAVVFLNTTGELFLPPDLAKLTPAEQEAARRRDALLKASLLAFVRSGHGLVGIHAATDTFYQWPEYGEMIGGYFNGHPWHESVGVHVEGPGHPLNAAFGGKDFMLTDEIYQFKEPFSRERLHVLLSLDRAITQGKGARPDNDYALAWIRNEGSGRVFYSALGHREEIYANPVMRKFFLDGIRWALGDLKADAAPGTARADLFMGEYEGTWTPAGGAPATAGARVIPEGQGRYRVALGAEGLAVEQGGVIEGQRLVLSQPANDGSVLAWDAAGPYRQQGKDGEGLFDVAFPPEAAAPRNVRWVTVAGGGAVDLRKVLGPEEQCAGYLRASIGSAVDQDARLELGSDDGIKAWLNGTLVHAKNVMRGLTAGEDVAPVRLRKGLNVLLLKITQGGGDWAAHARIVPLAALGTAQSGQPLAGGALTGVRGPDPAVTGWTGGIEGGVLHMAGAGALELRRVSRRSPTEGAKPPRGAVVLLAFGKGAPPLAEWDNATWPALLDGSVRIGRGDLRTKRAFGDVRLHLEFMIPSMPDARGQGRGNSGVYFQDRYELQVLDSFGLPVAANECGAIYTVSAPRVNAALPPLAWQTYDVVFRAPRLRADGTVARPARFDEVRWNGIPVQAGVEVTGPTGGGAGGAAARASLRLQDHGNPVRYRNIWAVELTE